MAIDLFDQVREAVGDREKGIHLVVPTKDLTVRASA
jgi:hypothetical protein